MKKHQTYIKQPMKTHSRKTNQQKNYNIYKPVRTRNFALEVKKPMKTHKKINTKLLSTLLILLMITPALFTALSTIPVPVYASTGAPKLGVIDTRTSSVTNVTIANYDVSLQLDNAIATKVDGYPVNPAKAKYFTIIFYFNSSLVTFSGAQFYLYLSKDGLSQISSSDVQYAGPFNVADLDASYPKNVTVSTPLGSRTFTIGTITLTYPSPFRGTYKVLVGPISAFVSKDYKFIKVFDGQHNSCCSLNTVSKYFTINVHNTIIRRCRNTSHSKRCSISSKYSSRIKLYSRK
jgi:hypothetical protein